MSEHTAEFVLAPRAAAVFSSYADAAIPIYYWSTREGSRRAIDCAPKTSVQVVSIFARRPKVPSRTDAGIGVKFNAELFEYAVAARLYGIPTLAGVPVVNSLAGFRHDCNCAWFRLLAASPCDVELELTLDGRCLDARYHSHVVGPESLDRFAQQAQSEARLFDWESALEVLRELRRQIGMGHYARFMGGYRPFNILLLV